jgi:hypothetical protein
LARADSEAERTHVASTIDRRAELAGEQILTRRRTPGKFLSLLHEIKSPAEASFARGNYEMVPSLCPVSIG